MDAALRLATADDVPALAALYAATARTLGPWCYTPEQVRAWAAFGADTPAFRAYVLDAETWAVADAGGRLLGFSGINGAGEVRSLYVSHDAVRQGLGTRLLAHGLARATARGLANQRAWATPFSLPVFQRAGFRLVQTVCEPFEGAMFERHRVERAGAPAPA